MSSPPTAATASSGAGSHGVALAGSHGVVLAGAHGVVLAGAHGVALAGAHGVVLAGAHGVVLGGAHGVALAGAHGVVLAGFHAASLAVASPVIPNFGSSSTRCEVRNEFFCPEWVSHNWDKVLWPALRQHVLLTLAAVAIGFVIALALALLAHRQGWLERPTIIFTSILYTIPALALFRLLAAPVGLNVYSAEIALVSYTLLILFRNIKTGLREVPAEVREAAEGMGMSARQMLLRVELPLAAPAIVAGLRIATVTVISLATIAYEIANVGLGVPIHTALGEGPFKTELIAAGGLAILLALLADGMLVGVQRLITPWARVA
jgi:osmoprotectant transport system permease protein